MKYFYSSLLIVICPFFMVLNGQTPSDALLMESKQACALLEFNYGDFSQYWEGSKLRENQTIATIKRKTVAPMVVFGLFSNLNLFIGVPYIKTESSEPNGGKLKGASGLQDGSIALKYQFLTKKTTKGTLSVLGTVGFSTPVSNYLADFMPYNLGLGAPELSYRAILQYKLNNGLYVRGSGAYLWRGYSKAERAYYYNNGSFYSPWMDVPNAITSECVLGYWILKNSLQLELSYFGSKSTKGDDIRPFNAGQPTNAIEMQRLGFFGHYYFSKIKGLGLIAYHNRVIHGKNTGKINTSGVGITYLFNYLKKKI